MANLQYERIPAQIIYETADLLAEINIDALSPEQEQNFEKLHKYYRDKRRYMHSRNKAMAFRNR